MTYKLWDLNIFIPKTPKVTALIITQTVMLLRYFRLDEIMGNLVTAIGGLLKDLGRFLLIILLIIIPYGLIQENFIYPNQFLQSLEDKYIFVYENKNGTKDIKLRKVINFSHESWAMTYQTMKFSKV